MQTSECSARLPPQYQGLNDANASRDQAQGYCLSPFKQQMTGGRASSRQSQSFRVQLAILMVFVSCDIICSVDIDSTGNH